MKGLLRAVCVAALLAGPAVANGKEEPKPTHRFFREGQPSPVACGQLRGDLLYLNRLDPAGEVLEKSWAVGTCAYHLSGYGTGVDVAKEPLAGDSMQSAWRFTFGDAPAPDRCEKLGEGRA